MYNRIIIFGVILSVNQVHKNLTRSKSMTVSMDYGEYNLVTESEKHVGEYLLIFLLLLVKINK